jgi:hypothetical protein
MGGGDVRPGKAIATTVETAPATIAARRMSPNLPQTLGTG